MNKAGLLIGINEFKNYPQYRLHGCVNDVKNIKKLLTTKLDFTDKMLTTLLNSDAVKSRIMDEAGKLVQLAQKGIIEYIIITNSSHGTQDVSGSIDEPDGLDEIFCPHDIKEKNGVWDKSTIIIDDEWYSLFKQLPNETVVEFLNDSCHSGDSLRAANLFGLGLPQGKSRFIPPPFMLGIEEFTEKLYTLRVTHKKPLDNVILWSGCKSDQTSADANINNSYNGAFTYSFCRKFEKNKLRNKLVADINKDLDLYNYEQDPQLECSERFLIKQFGEVK